VGICQARFAGSTEFNFIQAIAIAMIVVNNFVYLFVVHLVALLMLDRLGNPIPRRLIGCKFAGL
jgi:uncharacterized protein YybS (DUF2232 family)